jgi:SAM-dependent methyltransferase
MEEGTYNWSPQRYIDLVEHTSNPMLKDFQEQEITYITSAVANPQDKVFIDIGAGYGRVIPKLSDIARQVIAIEIDAQMLSELNKKTLQHNNLTVISGDVNNLSELLSDSTVDSPVFLVLQNSFGTWKGDYKKALDQIRQIAQEKNGEIIISLFAQEGLKEFGIPMYEGIKELVGDPDLNRVDFEKGDFYSKTGYYSHWWRPEERQEMISTLGGKLIGEVKNSSFHIFHISYS